MTKWFDIASYLRAACMVLFVAMAFGAMAKQIPAPTGRLVSDFAGVLSPAQAQRLEDKLVAFDDSTSSQIAIVIENSTEGEDIFDYAYRLAQSWGIGQKGKDNGILIYVAVKDRKMRILTGLGTEALVTDAMAKRIIERVMVPRFRKGQFYEGLDRATSILMQILSGAFQPDEPRAIPAWVILLIFVLLFFLFVYLASRQSHSGGGGYYRGGRYDDPWRGGGWWIGGGGSGGSSGGFGGGGFGGFGGGSFGGGGAGGSW